MREEAKYRDISVFNNKLEKRITQEMFIFSGAVSRCSSEHNFIIRYVVFLACFLFSNAFLCNCPFELNYVQLLFTSLLEDIDAAFVSRDVTSTVSTAHAGISQVKHYFINQ